MALVVLPLGIDYGEELAQRVVRVARGERLECPTDGVLLDHGDVLVAYGLQHLTHLAVGVGRRFLEEPGGVERSEAAQRSETVGELGLGAVGVVDLDSARQNVV